MGLLTQIEVADRLRCSLSKVRGLRRDGKISYLPGRPVLIDEADLARYLEAKTCQALDSKKRTTENSTSTGQKALEASASALARQIAKRRRLFSQLGS